MNYDNNLQRMRRKAGLDQHDVADALGVAISTYRNWEYGYREIKSDSLIKLSELFGCSVDDLLGTGMSIPSSNIIPMTLKAPLYGAITAGEPREMWTLEDQLPIPNNLVDKYPNAFFLRVDGDSMNVIVPQGSYALINPDAEVHNGDIVAVNINGYEATLKTWYKTSNSLILSPNSTNKEHKDIIYSEDSVNCPKVRVIGVMVWFMGEFR